jgi:hypothetical protein
VVDSARLWPDGRRGQSGQAPGPRTLLIFPTAWRAMAARETVDCHWPLPDVGNLESNSSFRNWKGQTLVVAGVDQGHQDLLEEMGSGWFELVILDDCDG